MKKNNKECKTVKVENDKLYINDTIVPSGYILKAEEFDSQSLIDIYTWAMDSYLKKISTDGVCESCQV